MAASPRVFLRYSSYSGKLPSKKVNLLLSSKARMCVAMRSRNQRSWEMSALFRVRVWVSPRDRVLFGTRTLGWLGKERVDVALERWKLALQDAPHNLIRNRGVAMDQKVAEGHDTGSVCNAMR